MPRSLGHAKIVLRSASEIQAFCMNFESKGRAIQTLKALRACEPCPDMLAHCAGQANTESFIRGRIILEHNLRKHFPVAHIVIEADDTKLETWNMPKSGHGIPKSCSKILALTMKGGDRSFRAACLELFWGLRGLGIQGFRV